MPLSSPPADLAPLVGSDDRRLPPAAGILIAMTASVALWAAIYAACLWSF
jgi:hypothetical protein